MRVPGIFLHPVELHECVPVEVVELFFRFSLVVHAHALLVKAPFHFLDAELGGERVLVLDFLELFDDGHAGLGALLVADGEVGLPRVPRQHEARLVEAGVAGAASLPVTGSHGIVHEQQLLGDLRRVLGTNPLRVDDVALHREHEVALRDDVADLAPVQLAHLLLEVLHAHLEQRAVEQLVLVGDEVRADVAQVDDLLEVHAQWVVRIGEHEADAAVERDRALGAVLVIDGWFASGCHDVSLQHELPRVAQEEGAAFHVVPDARAIV